MTKENKYIVSGFKFHQQFLDDIRLVQQKTEGRLTASALTVFLTMLSEIDSTKRQDGILTNYNLSKWARKLSIQPQTLWNGYQNLVENRFIEEIIHNGKHAILIRDYADYDNPAKNKLNYMTVPNMIFDTSVLKELVRISCPSAIILMLEILNQTRTRLGNDLKGKNTEIYFTMNMETLKRKLNRRAEGVRRVLDILSIVFSIKANETKIYTINPRVNKKAHKQVWIHSYQIGLKQEFYTTKNEKNKEVHQLMALANKTAMYYFTQLGIPFSNEDKQDFVTVFRFEIVEKLRVLSEYSKNEFNYISESKNLLHNLFEDLEASWHKDGDIDIRSIGGFFRTRFSNMLSYYLHYSGEVDYSLIHEVKVAFYTKQGVVPTWLESPRMKNRKSA